MCSCAILDNIPLRDHPKFKKNYNLTVILAISFYKPEVILYSIKTLKVAECLLNCLF